MTHAALKLRFILIRDSQTGMVARWSRCSVPYVMISVIQYLRVLRGLAEGEYCCTSMPENFRLL